MEIERDWGVWRGGGRCKVINNLWVKSNKRQRGVGLGIALADRPCLLRRHIIIMPRSAELQGGNGTTVASPGVQMHLQQLYSGATCY